MGFVDRFELELIIQLVLSAILAGVLGWERGRRGQPAGLRTYMLVAMASTSFTQVGAYGFLQPGMPHDPMRVAAQVVTGIGFLGAGAIWRSGTAPRGLTTAAGLWVSAALGMVVAAGFYPLALVLTVLSWLIFRVGWLIEQRLGVKPGETGQSAESAEDGNGNGNDNATNVS